jgi:predicted extracellular nuclease
MSGSKVSLVAAGLVLLTFINRGSSQDAKLRPVRLMFYNVENLFDFTHDSLKNDIDFLPGGIMKWNYTRYRKKITSLYKTIVSAGLDDPPEIVAMCEVENRKVLNDLIYGTYLSKFDYRIIHEDSPDQRGIDVCLIYRGDSLKMAGFRYWMPRGISKEEYNTRSVLYVSFAYRGDTIHLIINHWPSRRGGVLAGEELRGEISAMIAEKADSISRINSGAAKIIIAGDFNCTPDDDEIKVLVSRRDRDYHLINLSEKIAAKGQGTYRYQGVWEMIDQVIVSNSLLNCKKGLVTNSDLLTVFRPDFLLKKDPKYPGYSPLSTYRGYRYQGGFSDHLPVLLDLDFR